ncbi:MAG: hypothetical protein JWO45_701, partial [Spartobacteria bacterium]|nr:hypothetical protein [Spartobacteria bacterium]
CAEKRPRKLQLYSVTVTQTYKFQAGAQSEEALKQVVKELEKKSG